MNNPFSRGFLLNRAEAVADTPPAPKIDPGAPFTHDDKPPTSKEPAKPDKSAAEKEVERLTADLKAAKDETKRLADSEKYWSDRARSRQPEPKPEPEETPTRELAPPDPFEGEKPTEFLDDLSVNGLKAAFKRGVISKAQLDDAIEKLAGNLERRIDEKIDSATRHNRTDAELARLYPELMQDAALVAKGEAPTTDLYIRTNEKYKEMLAFDPSLKQSPALLMSAAASAKKELAMEAELEAAKKGEKQSTRRARIDAAHPDREAPGGDEHGEGDQLSPQQRSIVNSLSRFGATEEGFQKFTRRK